MDITKEKVALGVPLKMDGKTEKFIGNAKGERDAHAQLPRALHRAGEGVTALQDNGSAMVRLGHISGNGDVALINRYGALFSSVSFFC